MSLSYYSIVQFAPNPMSGERVNIGIIVFNPELPYGRVIFDESDRRARRLAPEADLSVVEQVRQELEAVMPTKDGQQMLGLSGSRSWSLEQFERLHRDAGNVIQFTLPLASSDLPDRLLDRLKPIYLPSLPGRTRSRDTRAVRGHMKHELAQVGLTSWLREDFSVAGRLDQYRFDLALVRNGDGTAEQLIETMALAKADVDASRRELDALGYSVYDLRRGKVTQPVALIVTPDPSGELVGLATGILKEFDGEVVIEDAATSWVRGVSNRLLTESKSSH